MNLKQLQTEWREIARGNKAAKSEYFKSAIKSYQGCANALTPHIQQQERDMELIRILMEGLHHRVWGEHSDRLVKKARARLAEYEGEKG